MLTIEKILPSFSAIQSSSIGQLAGRLVETLNNLYASLRNTVEKVIQAAEKFFYGTAPAEQTPAKPLTERSIQPLAAETPQSSDAQKPEASPTSQWNWKVVAAGVAVVALGALALGVYLSKPPICSYDTIAGKAGLEIGSLLEDVDQKLPCGAHKKMSELCQIAISERRTPDGLIRLGDYLKDGWKASVNIEGSSPQPICFGKFKEPLKEHVVHCPSVEFPKCPVDKFEGNLGRTCTNVTKEYVNSFAGQRIQRLVDSTFQLIGDSHKNLKGLAVDSKWDPRCLFNKCTIMKPNEALQMCFKSHIYV